jgi:hypothetical protein
MRTLRSTPLERGALPGDTLAACGVASVATYFPGFHRSVDNDILWGERWTEWENLRDEVNDSVAHMAVRHPRRGYYDIWDEGAATLRAQAAEARSAGVRAFMFYHYWFAHGRTALSRPLEDALLGTAADGAANAKELPSIGLPFFFSWANEPWEQRRIRANTFKGDATSSGGPPLPPRVTLINQDYGGRADWEAHFHWLLRFFRHPDYVRVGDAPLMVIYDASDFDRARITQPLHWCANHTAGRPANDRCGGQTVPFGCAAAELYLRWYPHLRFLGVENAYAYQTALGQHLGYAWPKSDPCAQGTTRMHKKLLSQMLACWQRLARLHGLPNGLHVLFTMNHQAGSANRRVAGDMPNHGMVQFLPTSMVSMPFMTRGWPWGAGGNFYWGLTRKCYRQHAGLPASTNLTTLHPRRGWKMSCECLLRHFGSDEVDFRYSNAVNGGSSARHDLSFVRGVFATWSNYPRVKHKAAAYCKYSSPDAFRELLHRQLQRALADAGGSQACARTAGNATASAEAKWRHLVLVNSWNEWGEQNAIEPSVQDGTALLDAHRDAVNAAIQ